MIMPRRALAIIAIILLLFPISTVVRADSNGVTDYWNGGLHLNTQIYGRPDGILQDGGPLNERVEGGNMGQNYLESIYVATGNYHKGIVAIDPKNGTLHRNQPSDVLPSDFGGIYDTPLIVSKNGNPEHNGSLYLVSDGGKIAKINARVIWNDGVGSDAHLEVYKIEYNLMWVVDAGDGIEVRPSLFGDEYIVVVTENGTVKSYRENGTEMWSSHINGSDFFRPISDEYDNIVVVADRNGDIYGLNSTTGYIVWENKTEGISGITISSRYRSTGHGAPLIISTVTGRLIKMDAKKGMMEKSLTLWEGCRAGGVFVTHDGGLAYVGVSVRLNDTWTGKSRIYCVYPDDMGIKWYQNVTGNVSSAPIYYDTGYTYLLTDSGYFYSFDESGLITARVRLGNSSGFSPVYAPAIPGFIDGGMIAALRAGDIFEFSKNIEYYGPSVEPLEWNEGKEPEVPWQPGQSWAYKWLMDFGKDSKNYSYRTNNNYLLNYSMAGTDGGCSKYLFIEYSGKDEYGYRFDFKGGSYAKGNLSIVVSGISKYGAMGIDEYNIAIMEHNSSFKGSFWLKYSRYANPEGSMGYFGIWRESIDLNYVSKVHVRENNELWIPKYEREYTSNETLVLKNFTVMYEPEIPFFITNSSDFSGMATYHMNYSGNVLLYWNLSEKLNDEYRGPFNLSINGFKKGNSTFSLSLNLTGDKKLLPSIPWVPEAVESVRLSTGYDSLNFMSVLVNPGNGLYKEIDAPFPISVEMSLYSPYLNSTSTTEDEVDDYLKDKAAYTPGIEKSAGGEGFPMLLMVGIAIAIIIVLASLSILILFWRKKGIK